MQSVSEYRPDIDWLRALAVLIVIGFHFEIPGFRGGFVGVDIFFVISGLLIGRIIQSELATGTFSFAAFFESRIRRLIPALYLMIAVVSLAGAWLLFGAERADFLRSILGVVTFTSNFLFWSESSYFDRASSEKPLLHTWSLGIEEQFYVLLPLALWLLFRVRSVLIRRVLIGGLAGASLAMSQYLLSRDSSSAFFLIHSRAWELLAGVMLTWLPCRPPNIAGHVLRGAGLALIVVAVLSYTPGTAFPGYNALLPVTGAALFLAGGRTTIRLRTMESIGRMSYSLYLWHWPIFTLAKLSSVTQTVTGSDKILLLLLLAIVSTGSYFLVERRTRFAAVSRRSVFTSSAAATTVLIIFAGFGVRTIDTKISDPRVVDLQKYERLTGNERTGSCFVEDWTTNSHPECFSFNDRKQVVLIWGDSLADQYFPGLKAAAPENVDLLQANAAGCFPTLKPIFKQYAFCDALSARVASFVTVSHPRSLIISADWIGYARRAGLSAIISSLKETIAALGVPVVIVGPSIQFKGRLPSILIRSSLRGTGIPSSGNVLLTDVISLDREMKLAFNSTGSVVYVSAFDAMCPDRVCPLVLGNGAPLTWDHGHLTIEGSMYAAGKMSAAIFSQRVASP